MIITISKKEQISNCIKDRLKQKGMNRTDFARIMQVENSVITKWLSGQHNFTIDTLFEIEHKLRFEIITILNSNEPGAVSSHEAEKEVCKHPKDSLIEYPYRYYCRDCGSWVEK